MSILIKGMEMPKSPSLCRFYSSDPLGVRKPYCDIKSVCNGFDDCPLVHIPPHGDLIDRDALAERLWDGQYYSTGAIKRKLQSAPTIIPAEEGE